MLFAVVALALLCCVLSLWCGRLLRRCRMLDGLCSGWEWLYDLQWERHRLKVARLQGVIDQLRATPAKEAGGEAPGGEGSHRVG